MRISAALLCLLAMLRGSVAPVIGAESSANAAIVHRQFIYETAPFPSCHASTVEETEGGLAAAWFGGLYEKHPEVVIYFSRLESGKSGWSEPVRVADGIEDGKQYACWNPVLWQAPKGPLLLFYKIGPSPSTWWGKLISSTDGGRTWSRSKRLPDGILGPVRNKPVLLADGGLLCGSSSEHDGWVVHMERTQDFGVTWERTGLLNSKAEFGAIQPTILAWSKDRVQILSRSRQSVVTMNWMGADWKQWSPMQRTQVRNPNSGIDAVMLRDGRGLLVYNDTERGRSPLNVAVSKDGTNWTNVAVLESEPGEFSYPAVIQAADGRVHTTYTWNRKKIRHVTLDPAKLDR